MERTVLFSVSKRVDNTYEKTHEYFVFDVPEGASKLFADVRFTPAHAGEACLEEIRSTVAAQMPWEQVDEIELKKQYYPLRNFLDVSFDSPQGWVGTSHRHGSVKHFEISENEASYGFAPTKITSGKWDICISYNAIVTDWIQLDIAVEAE